MNVEGVDPTPGHGQRHHPGGLRRPWRLDVEQRRPGLALVGAEGRDDVLAALPLDPGASREDAEPVPSRRKDDVGLVAIAFLGNLRSGRDITKVADEIAYAHGAPMVFIRQSFRRW